jgi:uncharacterized SAM-binding protein YcdF (DUF218 family)
MKMLTIIAVLGSDFDRVKNRLLGAIRLYIYERSLGNKPIIIFCGYDTIVDKKVKMMVEKLKKHGYQIMEEKSSTTTRENLQNFEIILKKFEERGHEIKELVVVTDYLHSIRARMIEGKSINEINLKYVNVGNYTKELVYDALTTLITAFRLDNLIARKLRHYYLKN